MGAMDAEIAGNLGLTMEEAQQLGLLHPAMMASVVEPVVLDDDDDVAEPTLATRPSHATPAWQAWGTGPSKEGSGTPAYVFLCNNKTQPECAARGLLAAPPRELDKMRRCIGPRTQLFLHNFESRVLLGPLVAKQAPDFNLEPDAFSGRFGAQVVVAPQRALRQAWLDHRVPSGPKSVPELRDLRSALRRGWLADRETRAAWSTNVQEPSAQEPAGKPEERLPAEDAWEAVVVSDDEVEETANAVSPRPLKRQRQSSTGHDQSEDRSKVSYPYLSRYYMRHRLNNAAKSRMRYFGGGLECSDDGHPTRWASWNMCFVCLEMTHEMRDCPRVLEMKRTSRQDVEDLSTVFAEAMVAVCEERAEVRCMVCGVPGAGHLNCKAAPAAETFKGRQERGELRKKLSVQAAELRARRAPKPADTQDAEFLPVRNTADVEMVQDLGTDEARTLSAFVPTVAERDAAFSRWASGCTDNDDVTDLTTDATAAAAGLLTAGTPPGVESAVLRLLAESSVAAFSATAWTPWKKALADAPGPLVGRAVHSLWRVGAIAAPAGTEEQLELTSLGWWAAPLGLPPAMSCTLLHGAKLGVLLPMAVLTVLLESAPLDMPLGVASGPPPRKSEHYGLIAVYFRWLEGRQGEATFRFGSDLFWETVNARVIAVMKYAQSLGYNGDDAAFEEMDGEVMDTRALHARPWTLAAALGNEGSERWARVRACLAAAFPPELSGVVSKGWVSSTAAKDGTPRLSTKLSSPHALIFAAGELRHGPGRRGDAEVGGVRGAIFGGDGAFDEAKALRTEYSERVAQAVQSLDAGLHASALQVADDAFVLMLLEFLRGSAGEFVCTAGDDDAHALIKAEHEGLCHRVLDLLGRGDESCQGLGLEPFSETAQRPAQSSATASSSSSSVPPSQGTNAKNGGRALATRDDPAGLRSASAGPENVHVLVDVQVSDDWVEAVASTALLRCLKRYADASRDTAFAAAVKRQLGSAQTALVGCRDRAACETMTKAAAVAEKLAKEKRQAVAAEDYVRANFLKERLGDLEVQPLPPAPGALERVAAEKLAAAFNEDYTRAAQLKKEQEALEYAWCRFEAVVAEQAVDLASDEVRRAALLPSSSLAIWQALPVMEEELWADVVSQLRSLAAGVIRVPQ